MCVCVCCVCVCVCVCIVCVCVCVCVCGQTHTQILTDSVDLRKAYDSVNRESLWRILQHSYRLPPKLLSIIQALHEDSNAAVRAYGKISDNFPVTNGV